jgi:hypothetical protein
MREDYESNKVDLPISYSVFTDPHQYSSIRHTNNVIILYKLFNILAKITDLAFKSVYENNMFVTNITRTMHNAHSLRITNFL